jgi:hypothetical protein
MDFKLEMVNTIQEHALLSSSSEFGSRIKLIRAIMIRDFLQFRKGKFVKYNSVRSKVLKLHVRFRNIAVPGLMSLKIYINSQ